LKAFHHETITNLDQKNKEFQAQLDKKREEIEERAKKCQGGFPDEDERKRYLEESLAMFKADEVVYKAIAEDVKLDPEELKKDNAKKQEELDELKLKVAKVTEEDNLKKKEVEVLQAQIDAQKKKNEEALNNNQEIQAAKAEVEAQEKKNKAMEDSFLSQCDIILENVKLLDRIHLEVMRRIQDAEDNIEAFLSGKPVKFLH
jgi:chromosome segregation ATPase